MNRKILVLITASLLGTQVRAGNVSIPNSFTDGTTASASEVNANFDSVASSINDNNTRINTNATDIQTNEANIQGVTTTVSNIRGINVYVDGVRRGALIDSASGGGVNNFLTAIGFRILLDSKYIALFSTAGDGLRQSGLWYESTDCTGQPYYPMDGWNPVIPRQGIVFSNDTPAPGTLYFVQAGTIKEAITVESQLNGGVCSTTGTTPFSDAYKAYVNNFALTGVSQSDFVGEVTVGF